VALAVAHLLEASTSFRGADPIRRDGRIRYLKHGKELVSLVKRECEQRHENSNSLPQTSLPPVVSGTSCNRVLVRLLFNYPEFRVAGTTRRHARGRFCAPADDAVGVLLEKGIGCKLAGSAASSAEEIAVNVVGDAGRFYVIVQTLVEAVMTGNVVLLADLWC